MRWLALILVLTFIVVEASGATALYRRLGGREGIQPMVSDFVEVLLKDHKIRLNSAAAKFLDHVDPNELKHNIDEVLCEDSGGPCRSAMATVYLKRVLQDIELTPFDWSAVDADFNAVLVKFRVGAIEQDELRRLLSQVKSWVPPKTLTR